LFKVPYAQMKTYVKPEETLPQTTQPSGILGSLRTF